MAAGPGVEVELIVADISFLIELTSFLQSTKPECCASGHPDRRKLCQRQTA
jgi:hypothetical protein